MLHNLAAEIARQGLKQTDISTALGISDRAFRLKMAGDSDFKFSQVEKLRDTFFPYAPIEYLMSTKPITGREWE